MVVLKCYGKSFFCPMSFQYSCNPSPPHLHYTLNVAVFTLWVNYLFHIMPSRKRRFRCSAAQDPQKNKNVSAHDKSPLKKHKLPFICMIQKTKPVASAVFLLSGVFPLVGVFSCCKLAIHHWPCSGDGCCLSCTLAGFSRQTRSAVAASPVAVLWLLK